MALANNTVAILNAVRAAAGEDYAARVPEATQSNIAAVGNAITSYEPTYLEFINTLMVKVGLTLISSKLFKNRLAQFKSGTITDANDVEEIFINMSKGYTFDPTGKLSDNTDEQDGALTRKTPDLKVIYHRQNREDFYKATITKQQLKRAFTSTGALETLLSEILNGELYTPAEYDEYVLMKELLAAYDTAGALGASNYALYEVPVVKDRETALKFIKSVRKAGMDLEFMSKDYNAAGVMTHTPADEQVLFVLKDIAAEVDTELLATAFNSDKVDFNRQVVVLDDFGSLENVYAILCDKDFFRVYDTLQEMREMDNGKGLFTNFFLHIWQILSCSTFKNAIIFKAVEEETTPEP